MKALLVTRCGCTRMVDYDGSPEFYIPLLSHFTQGLFRDNNPAIQAIESWDMKGGRRVFKRDEREVFKLPTGEEMIVYREQP